MNDTTNNQKFFDLHTVGIGYLNRSREVQPSQGDSYESVSIAALHGRSDKPSYSYFDTRVVGSDAQDFVKAHRESINDRDSKVLVRFKTGDSLASSYEVNSGDSQGKRNHVIKARLLQITWASINGVVVLNQSQEQQQDQENGEPQASHPVDDQPAEEPQSDPDVVRLDQDDPDFMAKKSSLKNAGYNWDSVKQLWCRPRAA